MDEATRFAALSNFVEHLKHLDHFYEREEYLHSVKTVTEIVENLRLKDFFLEYHCERAGLDAEQCFIAVINGKIISKSQITIYQDFDYDLYDRYKRELNILSTWWSNENRYYFYETALNAYQELHRKISIQG